MPVNPDTDALCTAAGACGYQVGRRREVWRYDRPTNRFFGGSVRYIRPQRKPDPARLKAVLDLWGCRYTYHPISKAYELTIEPPNR